MKNFESIYLKQQELSLMWKENRGKIKMNAKEAEQVLMQDKFLKGFFEDRGLTIHRTTNRGEGTTVGMFLYYFEENGRLEAFFEVDPADSIPKLVPIYSVTDFELEFIKSESEEEAPTRMVRLYQGEEIVFEAQLYEELLLDQERI
ncbi:hypothetical protein M0R04_01420 [Candidatus Dojkabacteria bacterium]|jgi:hypothetical protein|nr:hypothetical protein [Candidatus Dojkabacteria bacterium]